MPIRHQSSKYRMEMKPAVRSTLRAGFIIFVNVNGAVVKPRGKRLSSYETALNLNLIYFAKVCIYQVQYGHKAVVSFVVVFKSCNLKCSVWIKYFRFFKLYYNYIFSIKLVLLFGLGTSNILEILVYNKIFFNGSFV